jgi:hypothetical protein
MHRDPTGMDGRFRLAFAASVVHSRLCVQQAGHHHPVSQMPHSPKRTKCKSLGMTV